MDPNIPVQTEQPAISESQVSTPVAQATNNQPPQPQNYLPGIKQLFSQGCQIYKERWKTFVSIAIIPFAFVLVAIIFIILSPFIMLTLGKNFTFISLAIMGVSICLVILFYIWSPVALLYAIKDRNEKIGYKTSYGRSRNRLFLYIVLSILTVIISVFGFLFFIIPGIIFSIWFSLASYIFVAENTGPIEALKKSKQYVNGKFFEVLYRLIGIFLISVLISIILALIPIVNLFSGFLIPLTISVIASIYWFILYENLYSLNGKIISNPVSKTKLILLGVLIFILIAIGGVSAYILNKNSVNKITPSPTPVSMATTVPTSTPIATPDPTADWKTYTSIISGYSFKYPSAWIIKEECVPAGATVCNNIILLESYPYKSLGQMLPTDANGLIITFIKLQNNQKLTLRDFILSERGLNHQGESWPLSNEKIGDNLFIKETTNLDDIANTANYYIQDLNKITVLIGGSITAINSDYNKIPKQEYDNYLKTFNLVLSTFKFTDQTSATPDLTTNWKTYTNSKYGYTIKYPSEYFIKDYSDSDYVTLVISQSDNKYLISLMPLSFTEVLATKYNPSGPYFWESSLSNSKDLSFFDYSSKVLLPRCDASGPAGDSSCDKVISQSPYTNPQNITGYKMSLNLAKNNLQSPPVVTNSIMGPLYIMDVSKQTSNRIRALLFTPASDIQPQDSLLKNIIDSLKFNSP